jgi:beta-N-acetylhexosaminidase
VCRIKGIPAEFKAPSRYARDNALEHFMEDYKRAAVYLESLGVNLNLAPVADIFLNELNPCLEHRCFGTDAGSVSVFVQASVKIAGACGLLACLKHFPGLGAAKHDPHVRTATAEYDMYQWQSREMIPFADGVASGADLIMTTHLHLPKIDDVIVTGSGKIISEMIRIMLSFDGPVITDDLTMEGASVLGDIGERTVAAFKAGHDLLLFGQDFEAAMTAYDYFVDAFARGEIPKEQISASLNRVSGIKYKLTRPILQ